MAWSYPARMCVFLSAVIDCLAHFPRHVLAILWMARTQRKTYTCFFTSDWKSANKQLNRLYDRFTYDDDDEKCNRNEETAHCSAYAFACYTICISSFKAVQPQQFDERKKRNVLMWNRDYLMHNKGTKSERTNKKAEKEQHKTTNNIFERVIWVRSDRIGIVRFLLRTLHLSCSQRLSSRLRFLLFIYLFSSFSHRHENKQQNVKFAIIPLSSF